MTAPIAAVVAGVVGVEVVVVVVLEVVVLVAVVVLLPRLLQWGPHSKFSEKRHIQAMGPESSA